MRFMIIVKANADTEAGVMPTSEQIAAMGRFNDQLIDAGILLAGEGLHPSSKGAIIKKVDGKVTITDGPFSEAKELIAGFWLVQTKTREEVLEWCKRIPLDEGEGVELRQVFDPSDFVSDEISAEFLEKEKEFRAKHEKPVTR
jgi:hypothetical protein